MQMVVRTFQEVFPHVSVWAASPNDFLLVATPGRSGSTSARSSGASPPRAALREDFERFGWSDGENLVLPLLPRRGGRAPVRGGGAPQHRRPPLLEFSAPFALFQSSASDNEAAIRSFRDVERPDVAGLDPRLVTGARGHVAAAQAHWLAGSIAEARHQLSRAGPAAALPPDLLAQVGRLRFVLADFDEARAIFATAGGAASTDPVVRRYLRGLAALEEAGASGSLARLSDPRQVRTELASALVDLARRRKDPELYALAVEQFEAEIVVHPGSYQTMNNFAGVLYETRNLAAAAAALRRAIQLKPDLADTHFNLGLVLEEQGLDAEAVPSYESASGLRPEWSKPRERLASLRVRAARTAR